MLKLLKNFNILFIIILAVPLLILVLPILGIREMIISFIHRRIICNTVCRNCGVMLGRESITESNRLLAVEMEEFRRKFPKVKYRHLRGHDAVCVECGQEFKYHSQGRCYLPVKEPKPSSIDD